MWSQKVKKRMILFSLSLPFIFFLGSCNLEDALKRGGISTFSHCNPIVTPLISEVFGEVGSVHVSNDSETIFISIMASGEWVLSAAHAFVGSIAALPLTGGGDPDLESFPLIATEINFEQNHNFTLLMADIGAQCGATLDIVVHANVVTLDGEDIIESDSAFGFGNSSLPGDLGWSFTYEICCEPPPIVGCTYSQGYWKNHNSEGKNASQQIPWPIDENTELCEQRLIDILHAPPVGGNGWYILAHQLIAATLNIANGASSTTEVDEALGFASTLLENNCTDVIEPERSEAIGYAGLLDNYNNGEIGPGTCKITNGDE